LTEGNAKGWFRTMKIDKKVLQKMDGLLLSLGSSSSLTHFATHCLFFPLIGNSYNLINPQFIENEENFHMQLWYFFCFSLINLKKLLNIFSESARRS